MDTAVHRTGVFTSGGGAPGMNAARRALVRTSLHRGIECRGISRVNQGQIDVMVIFTTDGQLSASDVVVLEDDKQFYPSYLCGNVIRSEVLEEHPELEEVFQKLTGIISDRDMAEMNYAVETEGREPRDVAEEFLSSHDLLQ